MERSEQRRSRLTKRARLGNEIEDEDLDLGMCGWDGGGEGRSEVERSGGKKSGGAEARFCIDFLWARLWCEVMARAAERMDERNLDVADEEDDSGGMMECGGEEGVGRDGRAGVGFLF